MRSRFLLPIVTLAIVVGLWELVRVTFRLTEIVLPPIKDVVLSPGSEPRFALHCLVTVGEAMVGFIIGNAVAIITAVAIVRWKSLESSLMPYAIALKTTPVAAVAPILILWLGGGWFSKAAAAATVCFFPTLVSLVRGLRIVDAREHQDYKDLFRAWHVGWWQTLLHLRAPLALPLFFSALKISSSLALVGAIVAEFISADIGLGYLVVIYSRRLETAQMFSAVFASTLLGVLWFYGIVAVERTLHTRFASLTSAEEIL